MNSSTPWLDNKKWAENRIRSNSKLGLIVSWVFTVIWNALTLPAILSSYDIFREIEREPMAALMFLFPLIGIVMVVVSIRMTREWLRFGPSPLALNPFPASLGGHAGGVINLKLPYKLEHKFVVSLSCLESYISGSGKDRTRKESVEWQTNGICQNEPGQDGTKVSFRFDLPENLPESEPKTNGRYHLWRVSISAELPGADFDRSFTIPVYRTGQKFSTISQATESHPDTQKLAEEGVYEIAQISPVLGGVEIYFPSMQRPLVGIFTLIFGAVFAGAGIAMWGSDAPALFPYIFTFIGAGVGSSGIYYLAKSLRVRVGQDGIQARRFLFAYPLKTRTLARDDFSKVAVVQGATMQSGSKTTIYYKLKIEGKSGEKFIVGERLTNRREAEHLKEMIETYLG